MPFAKVILYTLIDRQMCASDKIVLGCPCCQPPRLSSFVDDDKSHFRAQTSKSWYLSSYPIVLMTPLLILVAPCLKLWFDHGGQMEEGEVRRGNVRQDLT